MQQHLRLSVGLIKLLGEWRILFVEKSFSNKSRRQRFFTKLVKKQVATFGSDLKVNEMCRLNKHVSLKNNVNLNGMEVQGNGKVTIGNNFHSGKDILLLSLIHI